MQATQLSHMVDEAYTPLPRSIPDSPRSQFLALGGLFGFAPAYSRSPLDEPQVLSQSLTFTALEEMHADGGDDAYCAFVQPSRISRVRINGRCYTPRTTHLDDAHVSLQKRVSVDTAASGSDTDDGNSSSVGSDDGKTQIVLEALDLTDEREFADELIVEKLNRRLTSFDLRRFNSFGCTMPQVAKCEAKCENATKRVAKKISKQSNTKKSRKDSGKMHSDVQQLSDASMNELTIVSEQAVHINQKSNENLITEGCAAGDGNTTFSTGSLAEPISQ